MSLGYIKVATISPKIKVADTEFNADSIIKAIDVAEKEKAKLVVLPALALTSSTAGELFNYKTLIKGASDGLLKIVNSTIGKNILVFVGLPFMNEGNLYNACACILGGKILGVTAKQYLNDNEVAFFTAANKTVKMVKMFGMEVPFGANLIFTDKENQSLKVGVTFGDDIYNSISASEFLAINGCRVIVNLSAEPEFSGERERRVNAVKSLSERACCGYVLSNAGLGESSTDYVFSGHGIIAENGNVLVESKPFSSDLLFADLDLSQIDYTRNKNARKNEEMGEYFKVEFLLRAGDDKPTRVYEKTPFIKQGEEELLLDIQAQALVKRIEHTNAKTIVLGLSGGLDSTLALIVAVRAMKLLKKDLKDVLTVTMPCFGTSSRTFDNSIKLAKAFKVSLKKISIGKSVIRHLNDLKHPLDVHDAAYENAQARERTQVLMDLANMTGGLVLGTGDLSELALGFATYNGDHMSMYAVNGSVPKTLVRHLTKYTADKSKGKIKAVLYDILDTPVSPELLPTENDKIGQVTEDIVGPYVLHDFFLYNMIVRGFTPKKIFYAAQNTFKGEFDKETILKWLKIFIRRFFNQQFKRSCLPDGVKVTKISLSPRGSWKMPSDAVSSLWLKELENL